MQLKSRQSSARSHLVSETRSVIQDLYDLSHKPPAVIKAKITYLLENDRFTCHPSKQEVSFFQIVPDKTANSLLFKECGFRFAAPEIAKLLFYKWFRGGKMRGRTDKTFLNRTNYVLICLTTACMYHSLKAWSSGSFIQPPDFSVLTAQS